MTAVRLDTPPAVPAWDDDLVRRVRAALRRPSCAIAYLVSGRADAGRGAGAGRLRPHARRRRRVRDPLAYVRTAVRQRLPLARAGARSSSASGGRRPPTRCRSAADELWDALATLTDRQRAAIVLRFYCDLPDAEIAAALGCREATVRTSVHRGLAKLRKEIDR